MRSMRLPITYSNIVNTLLLLFPIGILILKGFGDFVLLSLAILGLYTAISEKKSPFKIKELKLFSWITTVYFLVMLFSILYADGWSAEFHHLGRKLHFLLAPLIALAIFQIDLPLKKLLLSIKTGLIIAGIVVITQFLLGLVRPSSVINANIFGDIVVAMLFLSIVQVFSEKPKERVVTFIAILAGISAILLSANRGSWMSFLILSIIYISLIYKPFLKNNSKRQLFLVLFFSIMFGFINTQTNVGKRINDTVANVQKWYSGGGSPTSVGLRMEMWKAGLSVSKQSLWFGYGYKNANKVVSEYASNNKDRIKVFTHLHNEYITNLLSAGVVGLLSLLSLLFAPLRVFIKKLSNKNTYTYSFMGILLCIGYVTFGFTHVAFGDKYVNAFYVLFMSFLLPRTIKNNDTS
ncbi:conserved hypothetical protein [Isorropodon fossajaponicum endosymbiont JTNG4]|uniref:O-antigen ligase family protein n=1 Tax=Isorropodon fossajaponicum symbiont TaxID=883811 RepID=UPI0019162EB5|nr:O-antigen ligase family protein [Isorropodon fossajaponicum symbiont]BBB24137.1 conserved hypothetical protein [Isorropodon fossajaponicum endosymbiont JTNG4]